MFSNFLDITGFFVGVLINLLLIALICFYFKRKIDNLEISQSEQAKMLFNIISRDKIEDDSRESTIVTSTPSIMDGLDLSRLKTEDESADDESSVEDDDSSVEDDDCYVDLSNDTQDISTESKPNLPESSSYVSEPIDLVNDDNSVNQTCIISEDKEIGGFDLDVTDHDDEKNTTLDDNERIYSNEVVGTLVEDDLTDSNEVVGTLVEDDLTDSNEVVGTLAEDDLTESIENENDLGDREEFQIKNVVYKGGGMDDDDDYEKMTVKDLKKMLSEKGMSIKSSMNKSEIITMLKDKVV